jgi:glucose/arabinose dehydrogenase
MKRQPVMQHVFLCILLTCFLSSGVGANTVDVRTITNQLHYPWSLAFLPDGQFLVTEKTGQLRIVSQQGVVSPPIDGLPAIAVVGQGGLLDVVLHPQFEQNAWVYLSYVAGSAVKGYSTEVIRAELTDHRLVNHKKIFVALPKTKGGRHFSGRLVFRTEKGKPYLYLGLGDRGVRLQAQDTSNHHGSIVRLHDDGAIPNDNPFVNDPQSRPEIFSYGHRNIQGLALHPDTQALWSHEHGPQGGDEFNRIVAGENYGWPTITYGVNYVIGTRIGEGTHQQGMVQPEYYWVPSIAPSGLAFYQGQWLIGALKYQLLSILTPTPTKSGFTEQRYLENQWGRIRDVKVKDQTIYVLTDAAKGKLLQLHFMP